MKKLLTVLCIGACLNCSGQIDTTASSGAYEEKSYPKLTGEAIVGVKYWIDTSLIRKPDTVKVIILIADTSTGGTHGGVYWIKGYAVEERFPNHSPKYLDWSKKDLPKEYLVWSFKELPSK